jgi:hypothetical protein
VEQERREERALL